jgi:hypothetical protein
MMIQTQAATPANANLPQSKPDKKELATMVRKYIEHAQIIFNTSQNDVYRKMDKLHHMDMCRPLKEMCNDYSHYSMRDIVDFTMLATRHLEGILPIENNLSYISSRLKLDEIMNHCKTYAHA